MKINKTAQSKKRLARLLAVAIILAILPLTLMTAFAADESFVWEAGEPVNQVLAMNPFYDEGVHIWHINSGSLPSGLAITPVSGDNATVFMITGTPTTAGESGSVVMSFVTVDGGSSNRIYEFEYQITERQTYDITVNDDGNGTGSASLSAAFPGTEITLTAMPVGGYEFDNWSTPQGYPIIVDSRFTMPAENVMVTAHFKPVSGETPRPSTNPPPPPAREPEEPTMDFTVKKTDADGELLAGAGIRLEGLNLRGVPRVYDVVTGISGEAVFSAEFGTYLLSEYSAPTGYIASDEEYTIVITQGGAFFDRETHLSEYETVTFVNYRIPELNTEDHFAYMNGYPDGTFRPGSNMTRAEAVVMFSRLLAETMDLTIDYRFDCYPDVDYRNPSMDVPWYANQVCYMRSLGVLTDFSRDERFRPDEPVTRAEFATLASNFDNLVLIDTNNFSDVPDDHWAVKYINSAAAKGWIVGYTNGTFEPESLINRAEVVTLVNRILNRKGDGGYLETNAGSLPRTYSDFTDMHWAYLDIMEASIGHDYTRDSAGERWTAVYP